VADENPSGLGTFDLPLRLPGQYLDKETNLHYNYHRDYDSSLGRYVESDPVGLNGGLNTYAYVEADPLFESDPKGLVPVKSTRWPTFPNGNVVTGHERQDNICSPPLVFWTCLSAPNSVANHTIGVTWSFVAMKLAGGQSARRQQIVPGL
jgi:RHS repeat-associated protein